MCQNKTSLCKTILLLLLCHCKCICVPTEQPVIVLQDSVLDYHYRASNLYVVVDSSQHYTIDKIQQISDFRPFNSVGNINPKYTYWIRFLFQNPKTSNQLIFLSPGIHEYIIFYYPNEHGDYYADSIHGRKLDLSRLTKADQLILTKSDYTQKPLFVKVKFLGKRSTVFFLISTVKKHFMSMKFRTWFQGTLTGIYALSILLLIILFFIVNKRFAFLLGLYYFVFLIHYILNTNRFLASNLLVIFEFNEHIHLLSYHIPFTLLVICFIFIIFYFTKSISKKYSTILLVTMFCRIIYLVINFYIEDLYKEALLDFMIISVCIFLFILLIKDKKEFRLELITILLMYAYFMLYTFRATPFINQFIFNDLIDYQYIIGPISLLPLLAYFYSIKQKFILIENERDKAIKDYVIQLQLYNANIDKQNKDLESKIQIRTKELKERNEKLDNLIHLVSHNIRGPITSVKGLCTISKYDDDPASKALYIQKIYDIIVGMDKTYKDVDRVLTLDNYIIQKEILQPSFIFEEVCKELKLDSFDIIIYKNISKDLNIVTDAYLFKSILQKCIENVIHFRDNQKEKQILSISITSEDASLIVQIQDNGIGIQSQVKDKIFDLYYRGSEKSKGQGLGLYIVYKAVQLLKGTIQVRSTPGVETVLFIKIPFMV